MASGLKFDPAQMLRNLDGLQQRRLYALEVAGQVGAAKMETQAKTCAPWQDRTGFARGTIQGKCERREYGVRITLSSGVYYAAYLEFAMKKRWAILWPTMVKMGPEILRQIARIK
ncbi:MAG: hypothetical protein RSJ41_02595 [Clostridia bacterium]